MRELQMLMRARPSVSFWTDAWGLRWRVSTTLGRLNFNYPAHAALRRHVHHRDAYACLHCGLAAINVPAGYDGRDALTTGAKFKGWPILLVLDHIVPRCAGGGHGHENLQTLCERCNLAKLPHDKAQAIAVRSGAGL